MTIKSCINGRKLMNASIMKSTSSATMKMVMYPKHGLMMYCC